MRRIVFAAFALTLLAACQPATTELTEEQKAEITAEVDSVMNEMGAALQARDAERWLSAFTDDARWGSHFGPYFGTMEQFKGAIRQQWSQIAEINTEVDERFVKVLGPDAALVGMTTHGTTALADGQQTSDRAAMTLVWQRVDGVWKIVHGSANMVNQPLQPAN